MAFRRLKIFEKILQRTSKTRIVFFIVSDIIFISFSVWLAFLLRFEGKIPAEHILNLQGLFALALIFSLPIFYFFKLYSFSWAYVSTQELVSLFKATALSFSLSGVALLVLRDFPQFSGFPRSTLFISYFLIFYSAEEFVFPKGFIYSHFKRG